MPTPFIVQQTFRADLNAEELVHKRIAACNDAFAYGVLIDIKYNVLALENCLLGENVIDKKFVDDMQELEEAWEKRYEKKLEEFEKGCIGAVAPGLMKRKQPKHTPDFQHWRLKFIRLIDLCHQRNMWFKSSKKVKY